VDHKHKQKQQLLPHKIKQTVQILQLVEGDVEENLKDVRAENVSLEAKLEKQKQKEEEEKDNCVVKIIINNIIII